MLNFGTGIAQPRNLNRSGISAPELLFVSIWARLSWRQRHPSPPPWPTLAHLSPTCRPQTSGRAAISYGAEGRCWRLPRPSPPTPRQGWFVATAEGGASWFIERVPLISVPSVLTSIPSVLMVKEQHHMSTHMKSRVSCKVCVINVRVNVDESKNIFHGRHSRRWLKKGSFYCCYCIETGSSVHICCLK